MKKKIKLNTLSLLLICMIAHLGYSQTEPNQKDCSAYAQNQLIIEIDPTAPTPGTVTGTAAFTDLGGEILGSIIDVDAGGGGGDYEIYLVGFTLPNAYFSTLKEVHDFYECGGGTIISPSNVIITYKVEGSDYNYLTATNYKITGEAIFDVNNYIPYSGCLESYPGLPTIDPACNNITMAILDSGYELGTTFDNRLLINEGYDFIDDDTEPIGAFPHGTMVSSEISGTTDMNAENIKFFHARVLNDQGDGDLFKLMQGLHFSIKHAEIIVMCLETIVCEDDLCTIVYETLLAKADNANRLIVAAAGNEYLLIDQPHNYVIPGSGSGENMVVVGASACFQNPADFSNYGQVNVDIFAPGEDILVYPGLTVSGTSFAAPQIASIAATAALTSSTFDANEIKAFLMNNVIHRDWDEDCVTGGTFDYATDFGACSTGGGKKSNEVTDENSNASKRSMTSYFMDSHLSLSIFIQETETAQLQIIHLSGSVIENKSLLLEKGINEYQINAEQLPTGIYIISLKTEGGEILYIKALKYF